MRPTFHLVPETVWAASDPAGPYAAASLASEGFIHCTDGVDELGATFDRHYAADPRSFLALTIDLPNQEIRGPDGGKVKFEIDPFRKHCLMNGLDDIGLTMEKKSSIDDYEARLKKERAWA